MINSGQSDAKNRVIAFNVSDPVRPAARPLGLSKIRVNLSHQMAGPV